MQIKPSGPILAFFKMCGIDPQEMADEFARTAKNVDTRVAAWEQRLERMEAAIGRIEAAQEPRPLQLPQLVVRHGG